MNELFINQALREYSQYCYMEDKVPEFMVADNEFSLSLKGYNYEQIKIVEKSINPYIEGKNKLTFIPIREDGKLNGYRMYMSGLGEEKSNIEANIIDYLIKTDNDAFYINNLSAAELYENYTNTKLNNSLIDTLGRLDYPGNETLYTISINESIAGSGLTVDVKNANGLIEISDFIPGGFGLSPYKLQESIQKFSDNSFTQHAKVIIVSGENKYIISKLEELNENNSFYRYTKKIIDSQGKNNGSIVLRSNDNNYSCITHNGILIKEIPSEPGLNINIFSNRSHLEAQDILKSIYGNYTRAVRELKSSYLFVDGNDIYEPLSEIGVCLFESNIAEKNTPTIVENRNRSLITSIKYENSNDKLNGGYYLIALRRMVNLVDSISERKVEQNPIIGVLIDSNDVGSKTYFDNETDQFTMLVNPSVVPIRSLPNEILSKAISNLMINEETANSIKPELENIYHEVLEEYEDLSGSDIVLSQQLDRPEKKIPAKELSIENK